MLEDIYKAGAGRQFVAEVQPVIWALMAGSKQQCEPRQAPPLLLHQHPHLLYGVVILALPVLEFMKSELNG